MKKIIFIIAILLIGFLFIYLLISRFKANKNVTKTDTVSEVAAPTAFIAPTSYVIPTSSLPFTLSNILPTENLEITYLPITQIEFTFTDIVDPTSFYYEVTPRVNTNITTKGNVLTLSPEASWGPGITTITISNKTVSVSGVKLDKDTSYKIKTGIAFPEGEFEGEIAE